MSPMLVVFGVQGTLQVNNNVGFFARLKEALRHLLVFCLERPPMDFYLETVNKHCNFLFHSQITSKIKWKKTTVFPQSYWIQNWYKVCYRIAVNSLHYKMFTNLVWRLAGRAEENPPPPINSRRRSTGGGGGQENPHLELGKWKH